MIKATHQGILEIGNIKMPCFNLEDGKRVLSGRGMTKAIGMKGRGQGVIRIVTHPALKPFINSDLDLAIRSPIKFIGAGSRKKKPNAGYEATILHDLCQAVLDARDANALKSKQEKRYALFCETLIRSFAKVGIIALVDEATGYQEIRDRIALQKILEKYITDDWAKWTKTFPDEFYKQLFRLKGIPYPPTSMKRPSYVGHWTNDVVYSRLAPGVLSELKKKNPRQHSGNRKRKFHQYLTREFGHPTLRDHLSNIIFLMKSSANWQKFYRALNRASPKYGTTLPLVEDIENE